LLALVLTVFAASSCVPFPHHERQTPVVQGKVVDSGMPLAGSAVRVGSIRSDAARSCAGDASVETRTDAEGRFRVGAIERRIWLVFLGGIAHKFYEWEVCIRQADVWVQAFRNKTYTTVGVAGAGPYGNFYLLCEDSPLDSQVTCKTTSPFD
jgi:hypothetical protein